MGDTLTAPADDFLERMAFLTALHHHIKGLAEIPLDELPAPRVLAVDAPWGYGKSWIAERLRTQLKGGAEERPVAYIDAFRYDHHDDVFAVIAAAIMTALNPNAEKRKKYIEAAGHILKAGAPALVKGAIGLAFGAIGIKSDALAEAYDGVSDAMKDGASKFSEKAVEHLFESYSKTEQLQEDFQNSLDDMTKDLKHPFVVIIDELDRCRPSFALEVLERIKHLFSADKVVFVLFWNSQSIHESIRHTYGRQTEAEAYLTKFVALSIPLPLPFRAELGPQSRYGNFIERELTRTVPNAHDREEFQRSLAECAGVFNASLRDVQKAIYIFRLAATSNANWSGTEFAYLALLKVTNSAAFRKLVDGNAEIADKEAMRFPVPNVNAQVGPLEELWMTLTYHADMNRFDELQGTGSKGVNELDDLLIAVLKVGLSGSQTKWLDQNGRLIDALLSSNRYL